MPPSHIGIIALYRQQIKLIASKVIEFDEVEVLTADKSQGESFIMWPILLYINHVYGAATKSGRDKEVIIMSLTRSNETGHVR